MGGRNIDGGGKIKQGLVYRTSGKNQNGSLTSKTTEEMVNHLKVKTEVNVADSTSYNLSLNGTTVVDLKMDYGGSASHHFSRNAENVKNFFNLLADSSNYPVFFHCRIGTDRTGLCANLLYGLLGVELNEIYQDYLFSNFGKIGEKRYIGTKAGQDNIQNYMNEINNLSGSKFKVKVYNALLAIGVKAETLNTVISNLTDGVSLDSYKEDQIVATADKLTGNGITVTTDSSQRDHPNYYYKLDSSSKSVSYTFNASKSYKGQVVAYLGNSDHSSSKKIGDAISCSLDATNVAIRDITYADACMGNCSNRMNYYPVILGEVGISSGSHTIKITGTSNTMNLGTICIFDAATGSSGSQGGNDNPGEHTSHSYVAQSPATNKAGKSVTTYLCDCGAKYIAINFSDYSSINGSIGGDGKIANGTVIKWDIPAKAGTVQLQFNMKVSTSNHLTNNEAIFDASKYGVKINGVAQTLSLTSGQRYDAFGLSTSGQYFVFCTFEINNDQNIEVEFDHNNSGYRLIFGEQIRLNYAA